MQKNEGSTLKITVLSENNVGAPGGLIGEWGLSILIEVSGKKILLDTGEQGNMLFNARRLNLDLKSVDMLVMSHGHYDHSGGMRAFLRERGQIPVYAHPAVFSSHYSTQPNRHFIGVPFSPEELVSLGAKFTFVNKPSEIVPGLWVSGEVPRRTAFEMGDNRLVCRQNDNQVVDPMYDDMSLYCVTPAGLVIILGCAHAGLVNIIEHAREVTGINKIYGIIGGTHLGPVSVEQKEETIAYLQTLNLQFLAANHCTGLPMMVRLANIFGQSFHFASAGSQFMLEISCPDPN